MPEAKLVVSWLEGDPRVAIVCDGARGAGWHYRHCLHLRPAASSWPLIFFRGTRLKMTLTSSSSAFCRKFNVDAECVIPEICMAPRSNDVFRYAPVSTLAYILCDIRSSTATPGPAVVPGVEGAILERRVQERRRRTATPARRRAPPPAPRWLLAGSRGATLSGTGCSSSMSRYARLADILFNAVRDTW